MTTMKKTASLASGASKELRKRVYKRDGYRCSLCDDPRRLQIHHVITRGAGGPTTEMNCITLCPRCHALCHGIDIDRLYRTVEDMEQACVEYLSDLYANEGMVWNPWSDETHEWKF